MLFLLLKFFLTLKSFVQPTKNFQPNRGESRDDIWYHWFMTLEKPAFCPLPVHSERAGISVAQFSWFGVDEKMIATHRLISAHFPYSFFFCTRTFSRIWSLNWTLSLVPFLILYVTGQLSFNQLNVSIYHEHHCWALSLKGIGINSTFLALSPLF